MRRTIRRQRPSRGEVGALTDNALPVEAAHAVDVRDRAAVAPADEVHLTVGRVAVDAPAAGLEVVVGVDAFVRTDVAAAEDEAGDGAALERLRAPLLRGRPQSRRPLVRTTRRRGATRRSWGGGSANDGEAGRRRLTAALLRLAARRERTGGCDALLSAVRTGGGPPLLEGATVGAVEAVGLARLILSKPE